MSQIMCSRTVKYRAAASPVYIIKADTSSVTIGSNVSYATYSSNLAFFRRVSGQEDVAYSCYYTVFRKLGSTYTKIKKTTSKATTGYTSSIKVEERGTSTNFSTDAIVICMFDMPSDEHSGYLAELEIPVRKNGDTGSPGEDGKDGKDGKDAASLVFEPAVVVLHADSNGNVLVGQSVYSTVTMMLPSGATTTQITLLSEDLYGDAKGSVSGRTIEVWTDEEILDEDAEGYYSVSYSATINGVTYVAKGSLKITVARDGADGHRGNTGPMSYLAGEYDATVNYGALLTDTRCPVVHFVNGTTDEYWYPTEDYMGAGYAPSEANGWKKADRFEMVVTKILFTQFAKLGGFVVSGDFMLSQYGELIDADGNKLTLTQSTDGDGSTHWRYNNVDAYTYFRDYDPMAERYRDMTPSTYLQYYNRGMDYPLLVRNNWQYWASYESTSDAFYITLNSGDAHINDLKSLSIGGHYFLCGTDTNGVFHCLLMRKSQAVGTNNRLYGYREKIMSHLSQTMFRPVKVVNAATGEEWLAGGKVHVGADGGVTVEGTILAKNLYRNVCTFVDGGTYFNRNGERWFYNPTTGGYEKNPEDTSGKVQCIYDADIVFMLGRGASGWQNSDPVFMPRAAAFQGKIIEFIIKCDTSGAGTIYIGAVGSSNSMGSYEIAMLTSAEPTGDKYNLQPIHTSNNCFVAAPDTRVRFISMPDSDGVWKWVVIDETNI